MSSAIQYDAIADRGLAFNDSLTLVGQDQTGYTYRSQVRIAPDAPNADLVTITVAQSYAGSDTIANHISAGRLTDDILKETNPTTDANYANGDTVPLTILTLHISEADMELASAPASQEGDDVDLAWDLLATPSGGDEFKLAYGAFVVRGTVTQ